MPLVCFVDGFLFFVYFGDPRESEAKSQDAIFLSLLRLPKEALGAEEHRWYPTKALLGRSGWIPEKIRSDSILIDQLGSLGSGDLETEIKKSVSQGSIFFQKMTSFPST
jgi:hypothetical protein